MVAVVTTASFVEVVALKIFELLGGCTIVARGFFFGIVLFLRASHFLSFSSSDFVEELSCSSSHSHMLQTALVLAGISSRKGYDVRFGCAERDAVGTALFLMEN